jgi:hypothetical protein
MSATFPTNPNVLEIPLVGTFSVALIRFSFCPFSPTSLLKVFVKIPPKSLGKFFTLFQVFPKYPILLGSANSSLASSQLSAKALSLISPVA